MTRPKDKYIIFPDLEAEKRKRVKQEAKSTYLRERLKELGDTIGRYQKLQDKYSFELKTALEFQAEPETILTFLLEKIIAEFKKGLREYERDRLKKLPLDAHFQRETLKLSSTKFNIGAREFRAHFLDEAEKLDLKRADADKFFASYVRRNRLG